MNVLEPLKMGDPFSAENLALFEQATRGLPRPMQAYLPNNRLSDIQEEPHTEGALHEGGLQQYASPLPLRTPHTKEYSSSVSGISGAIKAEDSRSTRSKRSIVWRRRFCSALVVILILLLAAIGLVVGMVVSQQEQQSDINNLASTVDSGTSSATTSSLGTESDGASTSPSLNPTTFTTIIVAISTTKTHEISVSGSVVTSVATQTSYTEMPTVVTVSSVVPISTPGASEIMPTSASATITVTAVEGSATLTTTLSPETITAQSSVPANNRMMVPASLNMTMPAHKRLHRGGGAVFDRPPEGSSGSAEKETG